MTSYRDYPESRLLAELKDLQQQYETFKTAGLQLDMTRGKPAPQQLDLANDLLCLPGADDYRAADGTDCRNYGGLDGLPELKALFAEILDVQAENIIIGGNASLALMHDALVRALLFGVPDGEQPWKNEEKLRFLCPSPGYDRHFAVTEHLGFELMTVEMTATGPDMDQVEWLAREDPAIKGIWCVPRYSNPGGVTYSDEVVQRLATMSTAARDFRIFWDNAYAEHHLVEKPAALANILQTCTAAGHGNWVLLFTSTSKISLAGSGISVIAGSVENMDDVRAHMKFQTIGYDKINQLRHLRKYRDLAGIRAHMRQQAGLIRPKFDAVQSILHKKLGDTGTAEWTRPEGGYFVSLDVWDGCAERVVALAAAAGVKMTAAGAPFPYGKDPRDRNIRIAPTFPAVEEVRQAMEVVAVCVKLAAAESLQT